MTTLNGLVGIAFNLPTIAASTSSSSMRLVLIHQFDDGHGIVNPPSRPRHVGRLQPGEPAPVMDDGLEHWTRRCQPGADRRANPRANCSTHQGNVGTGGTWAFSGRGEMIQAERELYGAPFSLG